MEQTGVYLLVVACAILLLPSHHCCCSLIGQQAVVKVIPEVPTSSPPTVRPCLPEQYKNVFTQNCIDFDEDSDDEDQGDCPSKMHLTLNPGTRTVTCVCNFESAEVPLIYVHQKKQCYELFRKGPCRDGKVILIKNGTTPGCFDIPCPHMDHDESIVVFNKTCSRLGDPCKDDDGFDGEISFFRQSLICFASRSDDHSVGAATGACEGGQWFGYECLKPFNGGFDDYFD